MYGKIFCAVKCGESKTTVQIKCISQACIVDKTVNATIHKAFRLSVIKIFFWPERFEYT